MNIQSKFLLTKLVSSNISPTTTSILLKLFNDAFSITSSSTSLMSTATTSEAPAIAEAIESIPEPVPISKTDFPLKSNSFKINFNISWVVSWRPVPKAPWDIKLILVFPSNSSSGLAITYFSSKCIAGKSYVV